MKLTVLNVAYPLAPVGPDAVGGAEQVLTRLDEALTREGHRSIVIACQGSRAAGTLVPTPSYSSPVDTVVQEHAALEHRKTIDSVISRCPVDMVHLHGVDFYRYLPVTEVPVLVTLHLPPQWYPAWVFNLQRPHTFLHCVSTSQRRNCPPCDFMLEEIPNGVDTRAFGGHHAKRQFSLALGRICPEKGFHLAIKAAKLAQVPLLLGGQVFNYPAHREYFEREILPGLDSQIRFLGPLTLRRKRRLLAAARCVLLPSLAPETSSLVAMEALASGTPVISFPVGALPEIIEDSRTGFLVHSAEEMAEAIGLVDTLVPEHCRRAATTRFSLGKTIEKYFAVYHSLTEGLTKGKPSRRCNEGTAGQYENTGGRGTYFFDSS